MLCKKWWYCSVIVLDHLCSEIQKMENVWNWLFISRPNLYRANVFIHHFKMHDKPVQMTESKPKSNPIEAAVGELVYLRPSLKSFGIWIEDGPHAKLFSIYRVLNGDMGKRMDCRNRWLTWGIWHTALDASSGQTESPQRKLSSGHWYMMSTDAKKIYGIPGN